MPGGCAGASNKDRELPCDPLNLGGVRAAGRGGREEEKAGGEPWTAALRPLNLGGVRAAGLGKDHWEWTQLLKLKPPPTSQSGASSSYPGPVLSTVPSGDEYMLS